MDDRDFPYNLTEHAQIQISRRKIKLSWVTLVLENPQRLEDHEEDDTVRYAFGSIDEFGGRVLKVVYNHSAEPWRVITAYFDRGMRGKL